MILLRILLYLFLIFTAYNTFSQNNKNSDVFILQLLKNNAPAFNYIYKNPEKYRLQIIYTRINRDEKNNPSFKHFEYRTNLNEYFYPASCVKLPAAILALEKLSKLKDQKIDLNTKMIYPANNYRSEISKDSISVSGFPTLGDYITKMLVCSDNNAFNQVYDFVTRDYFNTRLFELGYNDVRITTSLNSINSLAYNNFFSSILFTGNNYDTLLFIPETQSNIKINYPLNPVEIGKAYYSDTALITTPKDFRFANNISLTNLRDLLLSVIFDEKFTDKNPAEIIPEYKNFLLKNLCIYPRETPYTAFNNPLKFRDAQFNYLYHGFTPNPIKDTTRRIFNIVGLSFGFVTDVAYFVDFKNKTEFVLSATIYVNEDQIINDDHYDYLKIAMPFFGAIGKVFYNYDLHRKRKNKPNFDDLKKTIGL